MDHPSSLHPATLALAGAALSRAMTSLDWQEGQQWRSHWCLLSAQFAVLASLGGSGGSYTQDTQAPLPAAAASPSTMFTSLPFPAAASCAAAPRLAEISTKPMLPSMPKTSPGAPPA